MSGKMPIGYAYIDSETSIEDTDTYSIVEFVDSWEEQEDWEEQEEPVKWLVGKRESPWSSRVVRAIGKAVEILWLLALRKRQSFGL